MDFNATEFKATFAIGKKNFKTPEPHTCRALILIADQRIFVVTY